jgi:hypothetical protein
MLYKYRKVITFVLACLIIGCGVVFVLYSHKYNRNYGISSLGGILLSFSILAVLWRPDYDVSVKHKLVTAVYMIVPVVVCSFLLITLQKQYVKKELAKNGVEVKGKILDDDVRSRTRRGTRHNAVIWYKYNGAYYKQLINNNAHYFKTGDSLEIVCSSHDPEMFKITGSHRPSLTSY